VAVNELADSSVNLIVRPWCQASDYGALKWDLTRQMKEGLEKAGCSIPYPQQDVHLKQAAGMQ
jgi:small conductance mechanosensitive channel